MKDETVYLRHILDEIAFLKRISAGRTLDDLKSDDYFAHAVRSAIEVIGEASMNVPAGIKSGNPDIPWREMASLRNKIIHGYFRIDYSIVWNVIQQDLPDTGPKIAALLKRIDERSG
ncbi:MAG: DUF86 domain-containing protein [Methanoregula sp.]|nr:DUF86 domain-containing protein [Methanoregula sp.]